MSGESTITTSETPIAPAGRLDPLLSGEIPIAVYGLGKLGLPVAAAFADLTGSVTGVDIDPAVVESVSRGEAPFDHEPGLDDLLASSVTSGALRPTTDGRTAATEASIHVIVVPVPLTDGTADLVAIDAVIEQISDGLAPGNLVVVESTVPPGTCAEHIAPALARQSGVDRGEWGLASCPERMQSGRALTDIGGAYPRIVGGVDDASTRAAATVYDALTDNDVVPVADARTAESVKLFEGVYRDVNIALANELARAFDDTGVDVREAIDAANTLPLCDIHTPGAGVGGHCIPYYPYFLMQATREEMPLVRTAREVNDSMPAYLAAVTRRRLQAKGIDPTEARVGVLGVSYRPGIPEVAATPARPLIDHLEAAGISVIAIDPMIDALGDTEVGDVSAIERYDFDGVVLVTAHEEFRSLDWPRLEIPVIVDGRDAIPPSAGNRYTVGRGGRG